MLKLIVGAFPKLLKTRERDKEDGERGRATVL